MTDGSRVTVVIPARDESDDIERCLEHVLAQDHDHDDLEVIVVDGASRDGTAELATKILASGDVAWQVVKNPIGSTPSNLNRGLELASGDYIARVDARSFIPPHYLRRCGEVLGSRHDIAVVGGAQVAEAGDSTGVRSAIARTLNNRFVMGGARYRSNAASGPDDTVYLGFFRRSQLAACGGWDEDLSTNQDFDLNRRMRRFGSVWFDDSLRVSYRPRGDVWSLASQYHRFGRAKAAYWSTKGERPLPRQWLLMIGASVLGAGLLAAVLAAERRARSLFLLIIVGTGAAIAVDELGSTDPAGPRERAVAVAAMGAVGGGWLSGIARGLVESQRRRG